MTFYDNLDENDKLTSGSVGFTLQTLTQRSPLLDFNPNCVDIPVANMGMFRWVTQLSRGASKNT